MIFSVESGTLSLAKEGIRMGVLNTMKDVDEAYVWAVSSTEAKGYDTIGIDGITEIAEKMLSDEKTRAKDPRQAYGEMQDKIAILIRAFRDLPQKNVYMTAKAELRKNPDGTELFTGSMPGQKSTQGLPYYFDEFFCLNVAESIGADGKAVQYNYLQTKADTRYEAKDRSGMLDPIERPDLTHIFNKIRAGYSVQS